MKYSISFFLFAIIVSVFSVSCSHADDNDDDLTKHKVGMISATNSYFDGGFCQGCLEAFNTLPIDNYCTIDAVNSTIDSEYEQLLRDYCEDGYAFVFVLDSNKDSLILSMAQEFPNTKFLFVDNAPLNMPANVRGSVFDTDESSYLAGFIAAYMANKTDPNQPIIGFVGGKDNAKIHLSTDAFEMGMEKYNLEHSKSVTILGEFINSFSDEQLASLKAIELFDAGVDVLYPVAGRAGKGALNRAFQLDKIAIGSDVDQYYFMENINSIFLTSTTKDFTTLFQTSYGNFSAGVFTSSRVYDFSLSYNGVGISPFHNYENEIPQDIIDEIYQLRNDIISGEILTR